MTNLKIPNNVEKIYIKHLRYFPGYYAGVFGRKDVPHLKPEAKGGKTIVTLHLMDGRTVVGTAECSKEDNFSRKIGRNIAIGRALKELERQQGEKERNPFFSYSYDQKYWKYNPDVHNPADFCQYCGRKHR